MKKEDFILMHVSNIIAQTGQNIRSWATPSLIVERAIIEADKLWDLIPDSLKQIKP